MTPKFEVKTIDLVVIDSSIAISYDSAGEVFTVETDEEDKFNETIFEYCLFAEFENYKVDEYTNASSQEDCAEIEFNNPCEEPFAFSAST